MASYRPAQLPARSSQRANPWLDVAGWESISWRAVGGLVDVDAHTLVGPNRQPAAAAALFPQLAAVGLHGVVGGTHATFHAI